MAHAGITLGSIYCLDKVIRDHAGRRVAGGSGAETQTASPAVDYRFILVGSLLPDIIDKPLGAALFNNTRVFCHSLLFLLLASLAAFLIWKLYKGRWGVYLCLGILMHLLLDSMWLEPVTFFWPFLGFSFPAHHGVSWIWGWLQQLTQPAIYVPELIGGAVLLVFFIRVAAGKKVALFVTRGIL